MVCGRENYIGTGAGSASGKTGPTSHTPGGSPRGGLPEIYGHPAPRGNNIVMHAYLDQRSLDPLNPNKPPVMTRNYGRAILGAANVCLGKSLPAAER